MKLGNPKHVIVLSIAAIGALAFVILRLIPSGPRAAKAASSEAPAISGHGSPVNGLPTEVARDAFSHPALYKRYLETASKEDLPPTARLPNPIRPLLGKLDPISRVAYDQLEAADVAGSKPTKNAGITRQVDGKPKSKIALKAIMRAAKPLALVTIDGHEDVTVGLGEYIDATYRITQFSQNAVLLASDTDKTWLYVGHEVTEK
jgi:hypothetical protein